MRAPLASLFPLFPLPFSLFHPLSSLFRTRNGRNSRNSFFHSTKFIMENWASLLSSGRGLRDAHATRWSSQVRLATCIFAWMRARVARTRVPKRAAAWYTRPLFASLRHGWGQPARFGRIIRNSSVSSSLRLSFFGNSSRYVIKPSSGKIEFHSRNCSRFKPTCLFVEFSSFLSFFLFFSFSFSFLFLFPWWLGKFSGGDNFGFEFISV